MPLTRLDELYRFGTDELFQPTMRRLMSSIEHRLSELEARRGEYERAIKALSEWGLPRINELVAPGAERLDTVSSLGFLTAHSRSRVTLEVDRITAFFIESSAERTFFTPTPFITISRVSVPTHHALARFESYDRERGWLRVAIVEVRGQAGLFNDWRITASSGVSESVEKWFLQAQAALRTVNQDVAQTKADQAFIAEARHVLETAGLNPSQFVTRDG